jgi:serine/threonine-protein kinase
MSSIDDARIEVVSLKTGKRRVLIEGGYDARYAPSGHLVYEHAGSILAVPFDLDRLALRGSPVTVVEGLRPLGRNTRSNFTFSSNGTLVYVPRGDQPVGDGLVWIDRKGGRQPVPLREDMLINDWRLSPDGRRLAVGVFRLNDELWIYDFERGTFTKLVSGWDNTSPVWTPDGARVAFTSSREGSWSIFWILADGSGAPERLTDMAGDPWPESFSPDGRYLAFSVGNSADIWILPIEGERKPWPFVQSSADEWSARFSPDGRFVAYVSNESGRDEVYVRPFPGPGARWQVSADGGSGPMWSHDGTELFYSTEREGKSSLYSVAVRTTPSFSASKPWVLLDSLASQIQDVSADGQRFLVLEPEPPPTELRVVLNWFEELKRRVPSP